MEDRGDSFRNCLRGGLETNLAALFAGQPLCRNRAGLLVGVSAREEGAAAALGAAPSSCLT